MAKVLLLTNTLGASAEVLPALGLLQHQVKILPAEASVLVDAPEVDLLLIDARRDLPTVKSFAKLLDSTGVSCPIIAITTEGGLTAFNADWGIDDVILDTAGPAEVDARIRIALGKHAIELVAADPHAGEIRTGEVTIDESTYTARLKGNVLDLTFKEFELLKYLAQHPGRVFTEHNCFRKSGAMTTSVELER
jgi:DNA-binding response OmpR family regulator